MEVPRKIPDAMPHVWSQEKRARYLEASRSRESIRPLSPACYSWQVSIDEHSLACQVQMPAQVQPAPSMATQLRTNCLRDPVSDEHVQNIWLCSSFSSRDKARNLRQRRCR